MHGRTWNITCNHPVGTTKMGADGDPMAVDSRLRLGGVENLSAVDAGAPHFMPAIEPKQ